MLIKKMTAVMAMALVFICINSGTGYCEDNQQSTAENDKSASEVRPPSRYEKIYHDDEFTYLMDHESVRWITCDKMGDEPVVDVWIRIVENSDAAIAERHNPAKYYLEHYYMRTKKQQVQFMCELEVSNRPNNNVTQRRYDISNWEDLIPGSIEDELYRAVMKNIRIKPDGGRRYNPLDDVAEFARIYM